MDKKYIAIGSSVIGISIIALIIVLNYQVTDNTYFCENLNILKECSRLSSTELRCYPYLENNTGYKDCSTKWLKISDYVAEDNSTILENETIENIEGTVCKVYNSNNLIKECRTEDGETYLYIVRF